MNQRMNMLTRFLMIHGFLLVFSQPIVYGQKDSLRAKRHSFLALPFVSKSIETGWTFGAAGSYTFHLNARDSLTRTSNIQALGYYSEKKQFLAGIDGAVYFPNEDYIFNSHLSYSFYPDKFWGLGMDAPDSAEEAYNFRQYYIFLHGQKSIGRRLFAGMSYEYQKVIDIRYVPGGLFDQQQVAGRSRYHVSGMGASLSYDSRNNSFYPSRGMLILLSFTHFNSFFRSDYRYASYKMDLRRFWKIYRDQILAAQLIGFFNAGKQIPLRSLASLGGSSRMRGYYDGRYRDKNLVVLQSEYRLPVFWRIGAVVFGGIGEVADRLGGFSMRSLQYSWGGGLRLMLNKAEKMNLRFDYGFGKGGANGFYIQFGEAF